MEQYLSVNVDMLEYLGTLFIRYNLILSNNKLLKSNSYFINLIQYLLGYNKSSKQPNFQYETFISNSHTKYETKNIEKPEAYAGELLMARYMYAFAYSMDAFKYLKKIKYFSE